MTSVCNSSPKYPLQAGTTLVGALIAILILSVSMSALFNLYINITQTSTHNRYANLALTLARNKIETIRYQIPIPTTGNDSIQRNGHLFQRSWIITDNTTLFTRLISVTVEWEDSTGVHKLTLNGHIDPNSPDSTPFI